MKRSETLAWSSLAALLVIAIVLLVGGIKYNATLFWAGMCLAIAQSLVVGLAAWGLRLASQRAELEETAFTPSTTGFRMAFEDSSPASPASHEPPAETKTLDTGFQRLLVVLAAILLVALAAIIGYLVYRTFAWARENLDQPFPIAGAFDKPQLLDELALVIALASASAYFIFYWITRIRRDTAGTGEAVNSNFTLGLPAMIALAIAAILGYLRVAYAAELAASLTAALMALQGFELLLNAFRSYSAIEELDQQATDLQALPLVPMLSSIWLSGVKLLFAQSVGLSRSTDRGVLARMLPRALAALLLIAILISCLRVVRPGQVAVLERLGESQKLPNGHINLLQPGLHLTFPWPIDTLQPIPQFEVQFTNVGAELHAPKTTDKRAPEVDFRFWTVREVAVTESEEAEDQFATGDLAAAQGPDITARKSAPQLLETFVAILWRVSDPEKFYLGLSHSEWIDKAKGETKAVPIYQEMVQQCASFAVTRTFASNTLDDIMINRRREIEDRCKKVLQDKLDEQNSGIEVLDLTIKDLHPPFGKELSAQNSPAYAYEMVTSMREKMETLRNQGEADKTVAKNLAQGDAAAAISKAQGYKSEKIARAYGEAARMVATMAGIESLPPSERRFILKFSELQAKYRSLKDVLTPVNKILVDPRMKDGLTLIQNNEKNNSQPPRPPSQ